MGIYHQREPVIIRKEIIARLLIEQEFYYSAGVLSRLHPLSTESVALYDGIQSSLLCIIVRGKVYDVARWLCNHPGGVDAIIKQAGKDATEVFWEMHSNRAKAQLEEGYIGMVFRYKCPQKPVAFINQYSNVPLQCEAMVASRSVSEWLNSPRMQYFRRQMRSSFSDVSLCQTARLVRIVVVGKRVRRLYFMCMHALDWEAGSHIMVRYRGLKRPYSPAFIGDRKFSLFVKYYENGAMSCNLHSIFVGETVHIRGPYPPMYSIADTITANNKNNLSNSNNSCININSSMKMCDTSDPHPAPLRTPMSAPMIETLILIGQGMAVVPLFTIAYQFHTCVKLIHFICCFRTLDDAILLEEMAALPESVQLSFCIPQADSQRDASNVPGILFCSRVTNQVLIDCGIYCKDRCSNTNANDNAFDNSVRDQLALQPSKEYNSKWDQCGGSIMKESTKEGSRQANIHSASTGDVTSPLLQELATAEKTQSFPSGLPKLDNTDSASRELMSDPVAEKDSTQSKAWHSHDTISIVTGSELFKTDVQECLRSIGLSPQSIHVLN